MFANACASGASVTAVAYIAWYLCAGVFDRLSESGGVSSGSRSMKRIALLVALAVSAYATYSSVFSATVRYRLTLQAEVDGEPKSGSGVIEVTYSKNNDPISQAEFSIDVRGEAVALDLGARGTLFALLRAGADNRSGPEYIVLRAFNLPGGTLPSPVISGLRQVRHLSGKRELPLTALPLLVRFRDPNDQRSVERVDPLALETRFGAGVKLVLAELEIVPAGIWPLNSIGITGEPITRGIEKKLSWWSVPKPWLQPAGNGAFIDTRTGALLNNEDFKQGVR
jgi:hypothetical protein